MKDKVELTHVLEAFVKRLDKDLDKVQDAKVRLLGGRGLGRLSVIGWQLGRAWA